MVTNQSFNCAITVVSPVYFYQKVPKDLETRRSYVEEQTV